LATQSNDITSYQRL